MDKNTANKEIKVLGIDTGKNSFHLHGVDARSLDDIFSDKV